MRRTLITLALSIALAGAAQRPACSEVLSAGALLDGQYALVECPEGNLRVTLREGQALPATGPARVIATTRRGVTTYTLRAGGVRYGIVK